MEPDTDTTGDDDRGTAATPDAADRALASAAADAAPSSAAADATPSPAVADARRITDAQTMRALTHPTRIALIEALGVHGAMTATQAAEHVGESPSSCSFHLRQLAKFGFVEEAGGGTGRRRPWRITNLGMSWSSVHDDPATEVAAAALSDLLRSRQLERLQTWRRTNGSYPDDWREAALSNQNLVWLTPAELRGLGKRIGEEFATFRERLVDPTVRPDDALPVEILTYGYPLAAPSRA